MNGMTALAQQSPYITAPFPRLTATRSQTTPLVWLMGLYVFFFPIQFAGSTINFAPSDVFLFLAVSLCFFRLRIVSGAWSLMHAALLLVFLGSAGVSLYMHGSLSSFVIVKVTGLFILCASYVCLTSVADSWREIRSLMRVFILSVSLNCLVSVIALKAGISFPGLNYNDVRVSGMFLDPNAFGGLVLVALLMQVGSYVGGRVIISGIPGAVCTFAMGAALFLDSFTIRLDRLFLRFRFDQRYPSAHFWVITVVLTAIFAGGLYILIESRASTKNEVLLERGNSAMERVVQIQRHPDVRVASHLRHRPRGIRSRRSRPHARFRRPLAHRGVRPGRADQFLSGRCQRPHRHAADRFGDGERRNHRPAVGANRRQAARRLHSRAACGGRGRSLPAVLHSRRSHCARPIPLHRQYDGGDRGGDRRRS